MRKDELIRELREGQQKVLDQNKHLEILLERHTKEKLLLRT